MAVLNLSRAGRIVLSEYQNFGGNNWNSNQLSRFMNYDKPYNLGVTISKTFASSNFFSYKPMTMFTNGVGNSVEIEGSSMYTWRLNHDDYSYTTVQEVLETGSKIGFGGAEFKIVLDEPWYKSPDVICGEDNNYPLEVVGEPIQSGVNYIYTVRLQDGDPNRFIPSTELEVGRTFCKVSTSVVNEENQEYGTISFGTQTELQSQIGYYADEFTVTDRVLRLEKHARDKGGMNERNTPHTGGYAWSMYHNGTEYPNGMFTSFAEAKLLDRVEMDREWSMTYGRASTRKVGKYMKRTGPGFRQLARDGWEQYYNTSLTASQLEDYFMSIFISRKDEGSREVVIDTGSLGALIFDQLLSDEASALFTVDVNENYVRQIPGARPGDLEYGYQFKSFRAKNGLRVSLTMNPMKDDRKYSPKPYPKNPTYTIDSARMDIYDFSTKSESIAPNKANMTMVLEKDVEEFHYIGGVIDPNTGLVKNDGGFASSPSKTLTCRRATSGSLCIYDTSTIGSLIYSPEYA